MYELTLCDCGLQIGSMLLPQKYHIYWCVGYILYPTVAVKLQECDLCECWCVLIHKIAKLSYAIFQCC